MFTFHIDKSYGLTKFLRSFFFPKAPLMTEFNIVGRFVTIGVDTLTEESAIIFQKLFNELINMGSISPVPRKYEAHMEMHNHHIFDELMTGDAIIRSAYGIPTHYHFILPINFSFPSLLSYIEMFQKQEKVLLISDKTLKEIRTAYRDYLKHMDIYEKDEWLRSTVLINVIPILSRNEEDLEEDSDKITFSTEEINQVISKAILKNRVKLLNKQELQDLENMLKKFKPKKDDPDILMPESKLSLFHVDLTKRPLLSLAAILTPPITCAMLIFSYFKYFRQPEETENNLLTTQDELVLLPLISGVVFSSKLTVDALRWCHEKFLPEVPARPYLPSRGENQQEGKKDTNVAVVPQSKMRLT